MKRTYVLGLAAALLAAATTLVPKPAPAAPVATTAVAAPATHRVNVGAVHPDGRTPHMFESYFPRNVSVHRGDRVHWEFPNQGNGAQAFHTVTFGDIDEAHYARADEAPGSLAFGEKTLFTTGCGRPGLPICVISSTDELTSSGTPIQHASGVGDIHPFDAVIDLPVGTYSYFCTLHAPAMQGTVQVVADDTAVSNPAPESFAAEIAELAENADREFAAEAVAEVETTDDGERVWTIDAGDGTDTTGGAVRVSTEAFLPGSLEIRVGETVRWEMGGTAHTVTFPDTSRGTGPPQHLTANCEFDGPATGAPGAPFLAMAGALGQPWCPQGAKMEAAFTELAARQQRAPGDAILSPATLHNSGIMISEGLPDRMRGRPAGSGEHFPSQFEATFPVPGTYTYRCLIHWDFMAGSITVVGGDE